MTTFLQTPKQVEILKLALEAFDAGEPISRADLKRKLSYGPSVTRAAVRCSVKFLVKHGLIELVPGVGTDPNLYLHPTGAAYLVMRSGAA
jgi:hypothetical protein